mgnify:CR=1 FL=1
MVTYILHKESYFGTRICICIFFWWYIVSEIMIFFCSLRRLRTQIITKIGLQGKMSVDANVKCLVCIDGKSIYFVIYQPCVYCTLLIAEAMIDWLKRLRKKYNLNTYGKFRGLWSNHVFFGILQNILQIRILEILRKI